MILRDLYLYPDLVEFHDHPETVAFKDRTRCLYNFLGRRATRQKLRAPFSRICVIGKSNPSADSFVNSSNVLSVEVPFTAADFTRLDDEQPNEYFIGLLQEGLSKAVAQYDIPLAFFDEGIEDFRRCGYRNEWVWKTMRPRGLGLTLSFDCSLTMECFELRMRVCRKKEVLLDDLVVSTPPEEVCFVPLFKRVEIEGPRVSVLNHVGQPTFSRDLGVLAV